MLLSIGIYPCIIGSKHVSIETIQMKLLLSESSFYQIALFIPDVFMQLKPHGIFKAILLTYIISSLLHGINVNLSAVLLTLGFATYAEYTIRKKIADIFDACVLATACPDNCPHRHTNRNPFVIAFNLGFRILAMVHLAYLGILLDGYVEKPDIGLSFRGIQERWGNLDYMSHWIIMFTLGLGALI